MEGETTEHGNVESSSHELRQSGMADEGEMIEGLVNHMEREDEENEEDVDDESSDEDTPMPSELTNQDFSRLVISEGYHVSWEYKENEVIQGAHYANIEDLKEAVKRYAISLQREFRVEKSSKSVYEVRCVKENLGCPWRIHAYKGK